MVKKKRQSDANDDSSTDSSDEGPQQSPTATATNGGCQHIKKAVDTQRLRKQLKVAGIATDCVQCSKSSQNDSEKGSNFIDDIEAMGLEYEYDNTLWLCLKCGTQLCGRSKNQHALLHFKVSFFYRYHIKTQLVKY